MRRARKLLLWLVLAGVTIGGIEAASWGLWTWTSPIGGRDALREAAATQEDVVVSGIEARRRFRRIGVTSGSEVIHPYLGYVATPSVASTELTLEDLGFPGGGPFVRERSPDTVTWAVFGGSFAAGFVGHAGPERVFAELQTLPALAGKRLVVAGFKQPQSLLALAYLLSLGLEIDAALLIDGFNEVVLAPAETVPGGAFPFFPRAWRERVANLSFATEMRALIGEIAFLARLRAETAQRLLASPLGHSHAVLLAWRAFDRALDARLAARRTDLMSSDARAPFDYLTSGPRWPTRDPAALYEDLVSVWKQGSLQMHLLCEGYGIRFHHFLQPNQYVAGSKPIGPEERVAALAPVHLYRRHVEAGYPLLRQAGRELREAGVRFHDLTQVFADVPEPLYVDTCCHLGARGNELLADRIAAALREDLAGSGG
jgi:hypothetical protein